MNKSCYLISVSSANIPKLSQYIFAIPIRSKIKLLMTTWSGESDDKIRILYRQECVNYTHFIYLNLVTVIPYNLYSKYPSWGTAQSHVFVCLLGSDIIRLSDEHFQISQKNKGTDWPPSELRGEFRESLSKDHCLGRETRLTHVF